MNLLQAIILGIVQGITEFLPISSSGHLIVLQRVFGMEEPALTFDIVVHLGTLLSIVAVFWSDIVAIIKKPFSKITGLLIVGTIPAVIAGFFLRDVMETHFRTGIWLAAAFTLTGFLLVLADRFTTGQKEERDITWFDAFFIGCCQALAIPPGISRSGTTITGALTRGLKRETAARFSFLLAIIAITGAGVLETAEVVRDGARVEAIGIMPLIFGFLAAALVGYICIRLLLALIKACKLRYFSFYLWGLAVLIFVDYFFVNHFF